MILFTYLKIILLQYFQFFIINCIIREKKKRKKKKEKGGVMSGVEWSHSDKVGGRYWLGPQDPNLEKNNWVGFHFIRNGGPTLSII